jgi:hypothetical protein
MPVAVRELDLGIFQNEGYPVKRVNELSPLQLCSTPLGACAERLRDVPVDAA